MRTHYLMKHYTACLRYYRKPLIATKAPYSVTCKSCRASMLKAWGHIPTLAELAATEADIEIERRDECQRSNQPEEN